MIRYQMKYKIDKSLVDNNNLKILGKTFVKNNRNKAKLIIENKKYNLKDFNKLNNFKKSELKIDILLRQDISNISYMFNKCESLLEILMKNNIQNKEINYNFSEIEKNKNNFEYNIYKIDENKGTLYEGLGDIKFYSEYSEISEKEVSSETESMYFEIDNLQINNKSEEMICEIESSSSLGNNLKLNNIIDMSYLFNNCKSLSSLSGIAKWNTNKVEDMSAMFNNCISLSSLPDISKWNTNNVINIKKMFNNCLSLSSLPGI